MIGLIGGGNMGEAIIKGMIASKNFSITDITVFDISKNRMIYLNERYHIDFIESIEDLVNQCDTVILAVKPQIINTVLSDIKQLIKKDIHLIISIAAGVKIRTIENFLGENIKIVRVMPNTPAFVLESMSALSFNKNITEKEKEHSMKIFQSIGKAIEIDETYIDAITAVSGSGPGFIAEILEAFSDGAVKIGLPRELANKLVLQTFIGSLKLISKEDISFNQLKNMVSSPGGTTIAGLSELANWSVKAGIINCIEAAYNKSKELSEE